MHTQLTQRSKPCILVGMAGTCYYEKASAGASAVVPHMIGAVRATEAAKGQDAPSIAERALAA